MVRGMNSRCPLSTSRNKNSVGHIAFLGLRGTGIPALHEMTKAHAERERVV